MSLNSFSITLKFIFKYVPFFLGLGVDDGVYILNLLIFLINDRDMGYVEFDTVANLKEPLIAKVSH